MEYTEQLQLLIPQIVAALGASDKKYAYLEFLVPYSPSSN